MLAMSCDLISDHNINIFTEKHCSCCVPQPGYNSFSGFDMSRKTFFFLQEKKLADLKIKFKKKQPGLMDHKHLLLVIVKEIV